MIHRTVALALALALGFQQAPDASTAPLSGPPEASYDFTLSTTKNGCVVLSKTAKDGSQLQFITPSKPLKTPWGEMWTLDGDSLKYFSTGQKELETKVYVNKPGLAFGAEPGRVQWRGPWEKGYQPDVILTPCDSALLEARKLVSAQRALISALEKKLAACEASKLHGAR